MDDKQIFLGSTVKALGDGVVGGRLVRFTGPDEPDLEGDYFDSDTNFGGSITSAVYYNHGLDGTLGLKALGDMAEIGGDDVGIWIKHQLDLRDRYERAIYQLAEAGKLGWSSGTASHLIQREQKGDTARVASWPLGLDASYVPTPADPGNRAMPLKAWAEATKGASLEVEPEGAVSETVPADTTVSIQAADVHVIVNQKGTESPTNTEGKTMEENTETVQSPEPVDVEAIAKEAAEEAVKAFQAALAEKTPSKAGYLTEVVDKVDRKAEEGYKSFGHFLQAVANGDRERLPAFKSQLPGLKGAYYDVSKAMGNECVGSLTGAALKSMKAPTGLGEHVPSAGGFLTDTGRAPGLMERVYSVGDILQRVDMVGLSGNNNGMRFYGVDETSRATGSRRGGIRAYWAEEGAEKTASEPKFKKLELNLHKVIGLVYATDELLEDASALESWILQNLPEELRFTVENGVIRGTGAGQPLGILGHAGTVNVAIETGQAADTIVKENIDKMWSRMWAPARHGAIWLINQDCEPQLDNLAINVGTGGQPVYMPPGGIADVPYGRLKGRPVLACEYASTVGTEGDIILANFGEYQMIEKGGVASASSIHVRFIYDESVFRFVYRVDGQPKWGSTLTPFQGTNTLAPFVTLDDRD